jgi:hypothetical protein
MRRLFFFILTLQSPPQRVINVLALEILSYVFLFDNEAKYAQNTKRLNN